MRWWCSGLVVLLGLGLGGCGKKAEAVVGDNRAYFEALRTKLTAVAGAVEQAPSVVGEAPCQPDVTLDTDPRSASFNLDVLHYEQLADADVDLKAAGHAIDLAASTALARCLHWTGPKSTLEAGASGTAVAESFATCRKVTHLLVARELGHDRRAGELRMRYDLGRIADARILCSFEVVSRGDPTRGVLSYEIKEAKSDKVVKSETRDEYASSLWTRARKDLADAAKEKLSVTLAVK